MCTMVEPHATNFATVRHPSLQKRGPHYGPQTGPHIEKHPHVGTHFRPLFGSKNSVFSILQAQAVWRWSNFLHAQSPAGQQIVRINLDETSIRLHQDGKRGYITVQARCLKRSARSLTSKATTSQTRGMLTLVAIVCDCPTIQTVLPQVLIVSEKHISKVEPVATLRTLLEGNTMLWTAQKPWVTSNIMCRIVKVLKTCLRHYRATHHFIVSADGYRAHLTKPVWRAMTRAGFMYHVIPAKLTWVLQPCDTHVFAVLKNTLRNECQLLLLQVADGRMTMTLLLSAVMRTIAIVLRGRSWRAAFWELGLTGVQACLSDLILQKLELQTRPWIGNEMPALADLQHVFPARAVLPIDEIFGWFTASTRLRHDDSDDNPRPAPPPSLVGPHVWHGRLRSSSSQALPDPAPPPHPQPCLPAPMSFPPEPRAAAAGAPLLPRARRLLPWLPRPRAHPPATPPS